MEIGDDEVVGPFQLGFNFSFYNQNYDQFWLSSNGFISFTEPTNTYTQIPYQTPLDLFLPQFLEHLRIGIQAEAVIFHIHHYQID